MSVEELAAFEESLENAALCYVEGSWAFFTTQPLEAQWGDDWDDAPYEHNAGDPYRYIPRVDEGEKEPWHIVKVAWEGPFDTPADLSGLNSRYSVEQINSGAVAWLAPQRWLADRAIRAIQAGTALWEFRQAIKDAGGAVYERPFSERGAP